MQRENSRQMAEMARHIKEKELAMVEEEKLRNYSIKQQTLIQELRRKLAAKSKLQGFFASTELSIILIRKFCSTLFFSKDN